MVKKLAYYITIFILFSCVYQSFSQNKELILNKVEQGLGGQESIKQAQFLMFSCKPLKQTETVGLHKYLYNWESGDARFESQTKSKQPIIVLFNAKTQTGDVYIDNKKVDSSAFLSSVIQYFKEDSYWLFTPILLGNHQLQTSVEHPQLLDSKRYYVLKVRSSNPSFKYSYLFLDATTGIIARWQTFDNEGEKSYDFISSNNKDIGGGLKLATKFTDPHKGVSVQYPVIAALVNIETDKFKNP